MPRDLCRFCPSGYIAIIGNIKALAEVKDGTGIGNGDFMKSLEVFRYTYEIEIRSQV
jgi:hypothetical protein